MEKENNELLTLKKQYQKEKKKKNTKYGCLAHLPILIILFLVSCIFYIILNKYIKIEIKIERRLTKKQKNLKIGVISVRHDINVGNFLLKYAISKVLSNLGFTPYIIGTHYNNYNLSFLNKTTNLVVIKKNFSEIKRDDYDILMVNSDQIWRKFDEHYYDYAFLKFAENWNIKKFVYGASLGYDFWTLSKQDEEVAKRLLKNFTGISIREEGSVKLIQEHLNITPEVVLDPTLLIDKQNYIDLIKNYSNGVFNSSENYIFLYKAFGFPTVDSFAKDAAKELNYNIYTIEVNKNTVIEDFIYSIINCKAVISNSFHGTIFSLLFNKPFITINARFNGAERLKSLGKLFGVENRIITENSKEAITLLKTPLNANLSVIDELKNKSMNFLKKNLDLI